VRSPSAARETYTRYVSCATLRPEEGEEEEDKEEEN